MHVAQNEDDENQDTDSSAVVDEDPLAQRQTWTHPSKTKCFSNALGYTLVVLEVL